VANPIKQPGKVLGNGKNDDDVNAVTATTA